jgi:hypothetical protein
MRPIIIGFGLLILCLLILFQIGEVNFIKGNVRLEVIVAIVAFIFFFVGLYFNYQAQEVIGYLTILLAMVFVFMGIRYYRNHINNGVLSFGKGLKIGTLIVLIPSIFFGLFDIFYAKVLNPSWATDYYDHFAEEIRKNTAPEKAQPALDKLQSQMEMFNNPVMQFLIMFATVFVIGFIVTIISSLSLMRKQKESVA